MPGGMRRQPGAPGRHGTLAASGREPPTPPAPPAEVSRRDFAGGFRHAARGMMLPSTLIEDASGHDSPPAIEAGRCEGVSRRYWAALATGDTLALYLLSPRQRRQNVVPSRPIRDDLLGGISTRGGRRRQACASLQQREISRDAGQRQLQLAMPWASRGDMLAGVTAIRHVMAESRAADAPARRQPPKSPARARRAHFLAAHSTRARRMPRRSACSR